MILIKKSNVISLFLTATWTHLYNVLKIVNEFGGIGDSSSFIGYYLNGTTGHGDQFLYVFDLEAKEIIVKDESNEPLRGLQV